MTAIRIEACRLAVAMIDRGPATEDRIEAVFKLVLFFETYIRARTSADGESSPGDDDDDYPRLKNNH